MIKLPLKSQVPRDLYPILTQLLKEEPAVLIEGPRGSGKSTLLHEIAAQQPTTLFDLDDESILNAVMEDPTGVLSSPRLVAIDEFQRFPSALLVVKRVVDREGGTGRYLLAGSVSAGLLPTGSETLTGRVHRIVLPPLSVAEVVKGPTRLLPMLVANSTPPRTTSSVTRTDYFAWVSAGGYPAALKRGSEKLRQRWYSGYLSNVATRDIPELTQIRNPTMLSNLYRLIAEQTASPINKTSMAETLGAKSTTISSYLSLLNKTYLTTELPGWTIGVSAKVGRQAKIHVSDTGLGVAAIGFNTEGLLRSGLAGNFLESFVLGELQKQRCLVDETLNFSHFRDRSGTEVDIIIERANRSVIAIEVKSATSINTADAHGLKFLRDRIENSFSIGIVFYTGSLTVQLDERIWALPISALWDTSEK